MADQLVETFSILVGSLKTMSLIGLRSFYGQSGAVAFRWYPCIKKWQEPLDPAVSVVNS